MDNEWLEVSAETMIEALGGPTSAPEAGRAATELLLGQPVSVGYVRVQTPYPSLPDGAVGYLVPRTRIFLNRGRAKELRGDVYATLAGYAVTHSVTVASAIGLFRRITQTFKVLDEHELDLVKVVLALTGGPDKPVATLKQVFDSYDGEARSLPERLKGLEERAVLRAERDGWVVAS